MNREDSVLKLKKDKYCVTPLPGDVLEQSDSQKVKWWFLAAGWRETRELVFNEYRVSM